MSWAPCGEETNTSGGIIHFGPSTIRVTGPPDSRNSSGPVSNCLIATSRRQYGSGFFGASGNVVDICARDDLWASERRSHVEKRESAEMHSHE